MNDVVDAPAGGMMGFVPDAVWTLHCVVLWRVTYTDPSKDDSEIVCRLFSSVRSATAPDCHLTVGKRFVSELE